MPVNVAEEHKALLENILRLLQQVARLIRPMAKMSRVGVAVKVLATTVFSYSDLVTDCLVVKTLYDQELTSWANASIVCIVMSVSVQTLMTMVQYKMRSMKEKSGRVLVTALGLGPLIEGFYTWTGATADVRDLVLPSSAILMAMKAAEVCFESAPESTIQMTLMWSVPYSSITPVQWVSLSSSFVASAFIATEGNFSWMSNMSLSLPKSPVYKWMPTTNAKYVSEKVPPPPQPPVPPFPAPAPAPSWPRPNCGYLPPHPSFALASLVQVHDVRVGAVHVLRLLLLPVRVLNVHPVQNPRIL